MPLSLSFEKVLLITIVLYFILFIKTIMRNSIDESLNLLKELEVRLKNQQSDKKTAVKMKTEQD